MKKFNQIIFLACGLLLTLAALPVFAQEDKVEINKMPFKDFTQNIKQQVETGKLDLTKSFSIELEGVLTKDGKLDNKKSKFTKSAGDAAMVKASKDFIEAVSDSGYFRYFQDFSGADKLTFSLSQDESQITANIKSAAATANKAKTIASGLNMMLKMAAMQSKNADDKELFNFFYVAADDKTFIINFASPREAIHGLLKKHLAAEAAKDSGK